TVGPVRRTLTAFHPDIDIEIVPGVSAVTAFTTALGIEIASGDDIALHEAARGAAPTGPDRMVLFKVTDVPATHEELVEAGYDVVYGRRLYMEQGETVVTDDPETLADRDYYTLAYAEKRSLDSEPATATFETVSASDTEAVTKTNGRPTSEENRELTDEMPSEVARIERAEGELCGDEISRVSR